jgi:hypothetical protein
LGSTTSPIEPAERCGECRTCGGEVQRWSAVPCDRLLSELSEVKAYEVEYESKTYQVEVEILENTAMYVHVAVSVDDGSLPASIRPETHSFMCRKPPFWARRQQ